MNLKVLGRLLTHTRSFQNIATYRINMIIKKIKTHILIIAKVWIFVGFR
jgi:hypothetical protein